MNKGCALACICAVAFLAACEVDGRSIGGNKQFSFAESASAQVRADEMKVSADDERHDENKQFSLAESVASRLRLVEKETSLGDDETTMAPTTGGTKSGPEPLNIADLQSFAADTAAKLGKMALEGVVRDMEDVFDNMLGDEFQAVEAWLGKAKEEALDFFHGFTDDIEGTVMHISDVIKSRIKDIEGIERILKPDQECAASTNSLLENFENARERMAGAEMNSHETLIKPVNGDGTDYIYDWGNLVILCLMVRVHSLGVSWVLARTHVMVNACGTIRALQFS